MPKGVYPRTSEMKIGKYSRTLEMNAKNSTSLKKYWSDPENKVIRSTICKKVHNLPEVRERHRAAANKPEARVRHSIAMKELHADSDSVYNSSAYQEKQRVAHSTPGYLERWYAAHDWTKVCATQKEAQNRPETKLKKRNSMFGKNAGEKHPNWKGGISNLPYVFEFNEGFKILIRERDNNSCQLCGRTKEREGRNLTVHHIYYDKENVCSDEFDFITLCTGCNIKVNYNRDFWQSYFLYLL